MRHPNWLRGRGLASMTRDEDGSGGIESARRLDSSQLAAMGARVSRFYEQSMTEESTATVSMRPRPQAPTQSLTASPQAPHATGAGKDPGVHAERARCRGGGRTCRTCRTFREADEWVKQRVEWCWVCHVRPGAVRLLLVRGGAPWPLPSATTSRRRGLSFETRFSLGPSHGRVSTGGRLVVAPLSGAIQVRFV